jgi:hypothetical protein
MIRFYFTFLMLFLLASCNSKNSKTALASINTDTLSAELYKEYPNSIYIGMVTGNIADSFERHDDRDSLFQLTPLTKSSKAIELRFFTSSYNYCILLLYDTTFSITGIEHIYEYDSTIITTRPDTARKSILKKIQLNCNPNTLFTKLVQNGVFSLKNLSNTDYPDVSNDFDFKGKKSQNNFPILELTKNGFVQGSITGLAIGGDDVILEYKVDTLFDRVYINSPELHLNHNPDFPLYRRRYEITELFLSCLRGVK